MAICRVCNIEILEGEETEWSKDEWSWLGRTKIHYSCAIPLAKIDAELKEKTINEAKLKQKAVEAEENFTRSVITDIQLPFERVLAITFQFFIAGLVLSIPIWIIFMIALS